MNKVLADFQEKIGANPDGLFGKETLIKSMEYYKISKEQVSHFFGQCAHESGNFTVFSENLNYSADGLLKTFKKYFPANATALKYARKPEMIANRVYSNRMGNSNEVSGDGWKYRGRGAIQLTGKDNYNSFASFIKDGNVFLNPELVATKYAFDSAFYYFTKNRLFDICKVVDDIHIQSVTKRVNGGLNGLADRIEKTKKYYNLLK